MIRTGLARHGRRLCALIGLSAGGLLLLGAAPAAAHTGVIGTTPAQGSQVNTLPARVAIRFTEDVGIDSRSMRVLAANGHRVDLGDVAHPDGDLSTVSVSLVPDLAIGSYLVIWKVVSDDSHPVTGTFTFGYGVPAGFATPVPRGDPVVEDLDTVFRFGAFAGTVVLLGGTYSVSVLWVGGLRRTRSRRLLVGSWTVATVSTAALFVLEGPYGSSLGLSDLGDTSLVEITVGTIYGKLLLLRLLALLAAAAVWWSIRRKDRPPGRLDAAGLALLIVESFSFAGHSGQGTWVPLAATMDALHLAAASLWLGGLAMLAVSLLGRAGTGENLPTLAAVLPRWSRTAMLAVTVLVITGVYQAWRQAGSVGAVLWTSYGRLILAKAAVLIALLVVANYGRRWIQRHLVQAVPPDGEAAGSLARDSGPVPVVVSALRRAVGTEVVLGLGVLALTSVLVVSLPAAQAYSPAYATTLSSPAAPGTRVHLVVAPTRSASRTCISTSRTDPVPPRRCVRPPERSPRRNSGSVPSGSPSV